MGPHGDGVSSQSAASGLRSDVLAAGALPQKVLDVTEAAQDRDATEWAAVHVHPRAEKVVAHFFASWGVAHYLPLMVRRRKYGARQRTSELPLFPGYVFFDGATVGRHEVLATNRVAKILPAPDPDRLRRELVSLKRALALDATIIPWQWGGPGSIVRIAEGPMRGLEGVLVRFKGRDRLVLQVHLIGRAVLLDVDIRVCAPAS
jgi:hypothetical protein